jgi:heme oxygenase
LSSRSSETGYTAQLIEVYGFEAAAEAALAYTPDLAHVLGRPQTTRSGLIALDLLALGMSAAEVARLSQFPAITIDSVGEALGWLYILERSTLMFEQWHMRIARQIRRRDTFSYLGHYGSRATTRWSELGTVLDRLATTGLEDRIISGALDAVRCEWEWNGRSRAARVKSI